MHTNVQSDRFHRLSVLVGVFASSGQPECGMSETCDASQWGRNGGSAVVPIMFQTGSGTVTGHATCFRQL